MRIFALFAGAVCMLGALMAEADLPPPKDPLVMPAIALRQTPELWVRIHRESEKDPTILLRYLEQHIEFVQSRKRAPSLEPMSDPQDILRVETHAYVLNRLGDVGTPDLIPAIEQFMERRKAMNDWATKADLAVAQLTIERIQARAEDGRNRYGTSRSGSGAKGEAGDVEGAVAVQPVFHSAFSGAI